MQPRLLLPMVVLLRSLPVCVLPQREALQLSQVHLLGLRPLQPLPHPCPVLKLLLAHP